MRPKHFFRSIDILGSQGTTELINFDNKFYTANLKREQLITATLEYWKIEHAVTDIDSLSTDPFQHCYICAETGREKLNNGKIS